MCICLEKSSASTCNHFQDNIFILLLNIEINSWKDDHVSVMTLKVLDNVIFGKQWLLDIVRDQNKKYWVKIHRMLIYK